MHLRVPIVNIWDTKMIQSPDRVPTTDDTCMKICAFGAILSAPEIIFIN